MKELKMEESQTIEFKEKFNAKKVNQELCGMLNAQTKDQEIEIHIGIDDNGNLKSDYENLDKSKSTDLVSNFLNKFEVKHSFVNLENGGFIIKATSNNNILSYKRNFYYRTGTTNEIVNENKYKEILTKKKLNMLTVTTMKFNKTDFTKLNKFLIDQKVSKTLVDFMFLTNMLVPQKGKVYLTSLGNMFHNDTSIPGKVFEEDISGSILDLYLNIIKKVKHFIDTEKTLQLDKMTRKTIKELYGEDIYEVTREIITNMLVHSSFNGIIPTPSFEVIKNDNEIIFKNTHVNENLAQRIKEKWVPHHAHNQKLFDTFRMLYLIEGQGIGFQTFKKHEHMLEINATNSEITISIKRRK